MSTVVVNNTDNTVALPLLILENASEEDGKAFEKLVQTFIDENFKVPVKFKVVKST